MKKKIILESILTFFLIKMIELKRYTPEYKVQWDNLVNSSRNGTFLFFRDYMDYHSHKFTDCSFLIYKKGKIEALLPANMDNHTFYSHQGLTYGGLILTSRICTGDVLEVFSLLNRELRKWGIQDIIYKPIPLIYHSIPSQEEIYALFINKAEKIACNISSTIFQSNKILFTESRKSGIRKSKNEKVQILESDDYHNFWKILNNNLSAKHNTKAIHSSQEIELLKNKFNRNIKLYVAVHNDTIVAGTVLYIMKNIVHVQYISASETGKELCALDLLFDKLINEFYFSIPVFDFGQSTEQMGNYLNNGLIFQKEGFGGRGIVYEIYKYSLEQ
jgi:hypothetical protein